MPTSSPDTSYVSANHRKYNSGNRLYQWHIDSVMEWISEYLRQTEPTTVLDAGCGEGFAVDELARRSPDVRFTGVDLSEEAISFAQTHFGERGKFRTGSIYKLPFSDNSFDTVVCSEVLEHLDDPARALAELHRVARNYVLITVPREPYFQWLNVMGQKLGVSIDPVHVNFWTKASFQDFIRSEFQDVVFDWKQLYQLALARM